MQLKRQFQLHMAVYAAIGECARTAASYSGSCRQREQQPLLVAVAAAWRPVSVRGEQSMELHQQPWLQNFCSTAARELVTGTAIPRSGACE